MYLPEGPVSRQVRAEQSAALAALLRDERCRHRAVYEL